LRAVDRVADRRRVHAGLRLIPPELSPALRVEREKLLVGGADEHHTARRRERATDHRPVRLLLPGDLPGVQIHRGEEPVFRLTGPHERAA